MCDFSWDKLNHLQLGKYAEYYVKMEFLKAGLDVYSSEVDNKGIDFIIRNSSYNYYDVQVKSIRGLNYIFFPKDKFELRDNLIAVIVVFLQGKEPKMYIIPSNEWKTPNGLLVSRDYEGKKSKPEWGINLSKNNLNLLEQFEFSKIIDTLE